MGITTELTFETAIVESLVENPEFSTQLRLRIRFDSISLDKFNLNLTAKKPKLFTAKP